MYLWLSFLLFFIGGLMAMFIRLELFQPGIQFIEPLFYNQVLTLHGLIMVFGAVMPAFVGLANWLVPMMIGAPDMALPRMNNFSFWILPFAFFMLISSLFMDGGAPNFGWTFYAPLSTTYGPPSTDFFILGVHLMGISSIMGAINIIRYDVYEDAAIRMDVVHHRVPANYGDASARRRGNNDADGPPFWHEFF